MTRTHLSGVYRGYVACLNRQDWTRLDQFVDYKVIYNGQQFGVEKYRRMLENDFFEIPDLYFTIELMISEPPHVASCLGFNCTPKGMFLGLHVAGKRVSFTENVFYRFQRRKIEQVWSLIDKAAIEAQI